MMGVLSWLTAAYLGWSSVLLNLFFAAEAIAWFCWVMAQWFSVWPRWHTLMCFFTTFATMFGFSLLCDFVKLPELSILIPMFMGMISKAAGPYFLMERDFDVRILLISFSNL